MHLVLDPAQHLSRDFCGLRPRDSVNAHQQKKVWIVRGSEDRGEAVAGLPTGVGTRRRARFHESVGKRKRATHLLASSVLRRDCHAVEDLSYAGLLAHVNQFDVRTSHAQG